MNKYIERVYNGIIKENPTFVIMLGMCPTLAVTTSAINGVGMGLTTTVVLILCNMLIAALRNFIPDKVRIPGFIVVIASFVTLTQLLLSAFLPALNDALGLYIPLIVVNCIILGRAEAYASKNKVLPSFFDGVGMGLGFTLALTIIGAVRELIGAGEIFGFHVMPDSYVPCSIFVLAPGAFFVLAALTAIQNYVKRKGQEKGKDMSKIQSGCNSDCMHCGEAGCGSRVAEPVTEDAAENGKDVKNTIKKVTDETDETKQNADVKNANKESVEEKKEEQSND